MIEPSMKEYTDNRNKKVWKRKEIQEEKMNEEKVSKIARFAIVQEIQEKKVKEDQVSRIVLSKSTAVKDHNAEKVKQEQAP
jgi:hypothetical protein